MFRTNYFANKLALPLLLASLLILGLCSCSDGSVSESENSENAEYITFFDALGREVKVEKSPGRVAALLGSFADVWMLSGGTLCASADDAWDDFGLDLGDAVALGGAHSPNLEVLISADPDFVLASASTSSNVEMKDALENLGITVAYFDVDCFEDYLKMLDICTDITGRKDLYRQNGIGIQERIEALKSDFSSADIPDKSRTVLLLRASAGSVRAKGSEGTVLGEMLSDLGCINIADSDESLLENLSIESILRQDPYRIFVVTMGNDTASAQENLSRMMEEDPSWGTLEAVREDRLYFMDRHLFNLKPNSRWAEAYEILGNILQE